MHRFIQAVRTDRKLVASIEFNLMRVIMVNFIYHVSDCGQEESFNEDAEQTALEIRGCLSKAKEVALHAITPQLARYDQHSKAQRNQSVDQAALAHTNSILVLKRLQGILPHLINATRESGLVISQGNKPAPYSELGELQAAIKLLKDPALLQAGRPWDEKREIHHCLQLVVNALEQYERSPGQGLWAFVQRYSRLRAPIKGLLHAAEPSTIGTDQDFTSQQRSERWMRCEG